MKEFIKKNKTGLIPLLILAIALLFRFWQITILPGGLFPDEAANGLDVNEILKGKITVFFERGNGREGLFFYLLAASVAIFGRGPWQHHIVSATIGALEVLTAYFLTKRLFGERPAFFAAFFMAVSPWHTVLSRTAFRAMMLPLFTTLTFYFILRYWQESEQRKKIFSLILAGLFFGLGFYTYIAYRMMLLILPAVFVLFLIARKKTSRPVFSFLAGQGRTIFLFLITAFLVISPLLYYFSTHPGSLIGRSGQVSVFSPDLNQGDLRGAIIEVSKKTAWSFFIEGDLNWRHNVSGQPFLPWLLSPLFLIGLIFAFYKTLLALIKGEGIRMSLILLWFLTMLAPEIATAEGIPHGLRLVGVIPAVFILPAIALDRIFIWLTEIKHIISQKSAAFILAAFLIGILVTGYWLYFELYANSTEVYYAYRSDLTVVSNYLNQRRDKNSTYLSLDKFSEQTVLYLTTETNNPYQLIRPEKSFEVNLKPGQQIIFTQSTLFDVIKFLRHQPEAKLIKREKNKFDQIIMEVYGE